MIPIANIQHFSLSDYPGVPSCIIFTQGCNLSCKYCHNKQLIPFKESDHYFFSQYDDVMAFLKERVSKLPGVVITGGEPLAHGASIITFIKEVKQLGFKVKLDTNGLLCGILEMLLNLKLVNYVALDIKAPWDKYNLITPVLPDDTWRIEQSLNSLKKHKIPYEIRTTYDKSVLTDEDLKTIREYVPSNIVHRINECKSVKADLF